MGGVMIDEVCEDVVKFGVLFFDVVEFVLWEYLVVGLMMLCKDLLCGFFYC